MKPVFCRILKAPKIGDDLRLNVTEPRGGRTEACHLVSRKDLWRPLAEGESAGDRETWIEQHEPHEPAVTWIKLTEAESCEKVAQGLAQTIGATWDGEMFRAHARKDEIVITCQMDKHTFYPMLNGTEAAGKEIVEVEQ
jgi:hypothetical protein